MKVVFEKLNARQKRLVIAYIRALLGYGEGYKKKAEESEKEDERKEQQNGTVQS